MPYLAPKWRRGRAPKKPRPSSTLRGYGYAWQQKRKAFLVEHSICRGCGEQAMVVDHCIPLSQGGVDTESNFQALCLTCHNRKTGRAGGIYSNREQ